MWIYVKLLFTGIVKLLSGIVSSCNTLREWTSTTTGFLGEVDAKYYLTVKLEPRAGQYLVIIFLLWYEAVFLKVLICPGFKGSITIKWCNFWTSFYLFKYLPLE